MDEAKRAALTEQVEQCYLTNDFNCAETTLMVENENRRLGLNKDAIKLVSAYGGGMGCGETCGALCAGLSVIGQLFVGERAHATEGFKELCGDYVHLFEKELGSIRCEVLREKFANEEKRCLITLARATELLEDYLAEHGK